MQCGTISAAAADFESYRLTHENMIETYADGDRWTKMSLLNTSAAGYFSADRCIREYADKFWGIKPVKLKQ